jgi:hypothetical protein
MIWTCFTPPTSLQALSGTIPSLIALPTTLFPTRLTATTEGIAAEPAGAAPIALLKTGVESGLLPRDETYVCIATGHHLKDPDPAHVSWNAPIPFEQYLEQVAGKGGSPRGGK